MNRAAASHVLDRVLVLEMVRVTEAAAIAASSWIGRGDNDAADAAAVAGAFELKRNAGISQANLETYAREVVWYGRKGGRFRHTDIQRDVTGEGGEDDGTRRRLA